MIILNQKEHLSKQWMIWVLMERPMTVDKILSKLNKDNNNNLPTLKQT